MFQTIAAGGKEAKSKAYISRRHGQDSVYAAETLYAETVESPYMSQKRQIESSSQGAAKNTKIVVNPSPQHTIKRMNENFYQQLDQGQDEPGLTLRGCEDNTLEPGVEPRARPLGAGQEDARVQQLPRQCLSDWTTEGQ